MGLRVFSYDCQVAIAYDEIRLWPDLFLRVETEEL
ncbi:hypothetical protein SDC9_03929 [bioreactor metagenome]|uniref:Uncharacterized protein n=1 Tax=bioreactor metagenome TaxID=1076179 RepID=A0A644SVU8_9ZZZZ